MNPLYIIGVVCLLTGAAYDALGGAEMAAFLLQFPLIAAAVHNWPLALGTVLYVGQAYIYLQDGAFPMMSVFCGYAFSNGAFIANAIHHKGD